jgi:hypothetical protein
MATRDFFFPDQNYLRSSHFRRTIMRFNFLPVVLSLAFGCTQIFSGSGEESNEGTVTGYIGSASSEGCDEHPEYCFDADVESDGGADIDEDEEGDDTDETDNTDDGTMLEVSFTTAWSASEHFRIMPGQNDINFGAWMLRSVTGDPIEVDEIPVIGFVDANGDGKFSPLEEDGINIGDYFNDCKFVEVVSRDVVMGPMDLDPLESGVLFIDNFIVEGEFVTAMNFTCDLIESAEELAGRNVAFAFDIQPQDLMSSADEKVWGDTNLDWIEDDQATMTIAGYVN